MGSQAREVWAIPEFRGIFFSRLVSNLGNGMSPIALAFGVLGLKGGNATSLSIVEGCHITAVVLFMIVGGALADKWGRARLVGGTDIIGGCIVAFGAFSFMFHFASVPLLAVNALIIGGLNSVWYPAFTGLMPQAVPRHLLQQANSMSGVVANLGYMVGAATAGIVIAAAGPGAGLMTDAVSFLIAGGLVFSLRRLDSQRTDTKSDTMLLQLRHGWSEVRARRWLVVVVVCWAMYHVGFDGFLNVVGPLQSKLALNGAKDMGYMFAAWGIGGMLGRVLGMRVHVRRPLLLGIGIAPTMALWIYAMAIPAALWLLLICAVISGAALDLFSSMWGTTLQMQIPEESLSRVSAYDGVGSYAFAPVGLFLAGPLAQAVGARTALIVLGTIVLLATTAPLLWHDVRNLENTH